MSEGAPKTEGAPNPKDHAAESTDLVVAPVVPPHDESAEAEQETVRERLHARAEHAHDTTGHGPGDGGHDSAHSHAGHGHEALWKRTGKWAYGIIGYFFVLGWQALKKAGEMAEGGGGGHAPAKKAGGGGHGGGHGGGGGHH